MPKFGGFWLKNFEKNVRFEVSTFEIGYSRNYVKIRKLIRFGAKCSSLGI